MGIPQRELLSRREKLTYFWVKTHSNLKNNKFRPFQHTLIFNRETHIIPIEKKRSFDLNNKIKIQNRKSVVAIQPSKTKSQTLFDARLTPWSVNMPIHAPRPAPCPRRATQARPAAATWMPSSDSWRSWCTSRRVTNSHWGRLARPKNGTSPSPRQTHRRRHHQPRSRSNERSITTRARTINARGLIPLRVSTRPQYVPLLHPAPSLLPRPITPIWTRVRRVPSARSVSPGPGSPCPHRQTPYHCHRPPGSSIKKDQRQRTTILQQSSESPTISTTPEWVPRLQSRDQWCRNANTRCGGKQQYAVRDDTYTPGQNTQSHPATQNQDFRHLQRVRGSPPEPNKKTRNITRVLIGAKCATSTSWHTFPFFHHLVE